MKDFKVMLLIFVLASLKCYYLSHADLNVEHVRSFNSISNRIQRAALPSWVIRDSDDDSHSRFTRPPQPKPASITGDPNPCNRKLSEKPNFNVPGRRISEAKCDETQWNLKRRQEQRQKSVECEKYLKDNKLPVYVPQVVGGRAAEFGEFPHMGALGWRAVAGGWKFQCGCSFISSKFLLTAAHCSSASPRDTTLANIIPEIVRIGVTEINSAPDNNFTSNDNDILKIIVHPQYASPKQYYDIALVELKYELLLLENRVLPVCLWTRSDTSSLGSRAFATGWGYLDAAGRNKSSKLQAAEVNIIDFAKCDMLLKPLRNRHFTGLQSHQLCAGVLEGGVDTCQGDSGGPLQVKIPSMPKLSYIIGVTSFGSGCARANSPGVYTRVSSFIDWIESVVWPGQQAQ